MLTKIDNEKKKLGHNVLVEKRELTSGNVRREVIFNRISNFFCNKMVKEKSNLVNFF